LVCSGSANHYDQYFVKEQENKVLVGFNYALKITIGFLLYQLIHYLEDFLSVFLPWNAVCLVISLNAGYLHSTSEGYCSRKNE
jgi:hypothetical protein